MIIIVDERILVQEAYTSQFKREGYPSIGFCASDFAVWMDGASRAELEGVTACLVADSDVERLPQACLERMRERLPAPMMVLTDRANLAATLRWFEAGAADVVRKPVHFRELLARIAVHRRAGVKEPAAPTGRLRIFEDGRDPMVDGRPLALPRRERRVLEHLASIGERRATKAQLYDAVYGMFGESVEEAVIESHVSKLRKKLRAALGYDPIDSRRYLGYRLQLDERAAEAA